MAHSYRQVSRVPGQRSAAPHGTAIWSDEQRVASAWRDATVATIPRDGAPERQDTLIFVGRGGPAPRSEKGRCARRPKGGSPKDSWPELSLLSSALGAFWCNEAAVGRPGHNWPYESIRSVFCATHSSDIARIYPLVDISRMQARLWSAASMHARVRAPSSRCVMRHLRRRMCAPTDISAEQVRVTVERGSEEQGVILCAVSSIRVFARTTLSRRCRRARHGTTWRSSRGSRRKGSRALRSGSSR